MQAIKWYPASTLIAVLLVCWTIWMLWLTAVSGMQHDYTLYVRQWALVLAGSDPWSTDNAYGPVHNLFALLLPLGNLVPKVATVSAFLAANLWLVITLLRSRAGASTWVLYALLIPTNALVIGMGAIYGLNDFFVAACLLIAALLRIRGHFVACGVLIGIAALDKYFPILLALPFALDERRISVRMLLSTSATFVVGMIAGYAVWGAAILGPFTFGADRSPKLLSILSGLRGAPDLIGGEANLSWLIDKNAYFVLGVALLFYAISWWARLRWLEAAVVTLLAVLLTYKVGHQQFYVSWLVLVAALPLLKTESSSRLAWCMIPIALFVSGFQLGYQFLGDGYRYVLYEARVFGGFVIFPLGLLSLAAWPFMSWVWPSPHAPSGAATTVDN